MYSTERSYGIVLYRRTGTGTNDYEFFIVKVNAPGFWEENLNLWSFPKGHMDAGEQPLEAAFREFQEEVGMEAPTHLEYHMLQPFTVDSGKVIGMFYADAADAKIEWVSSISATAEYPANSGNIIQYAETVSGGWLPLETLPTLLEDEYLELAYQVVHLENKKKATETNDDT